MKKHILFSLISLLSVSIVSAQSHRHSSASKVRVQVNIHSGRGHQNGAGCQSNHCSSNRGYNRQNHHCNSKSCNLANCSNIHANACNPPINYNNCSYNRCMDNDRFYNSIYALKSASFDSDRLIIAKNIANNNGLSSWQIREMLMIFNYESSRVEFAKYARGSCVDPENFYQIQDAFAFSSSISEVF